MSPQRSAERAKTPASIRKSIEAEHVESISGRAAIFALVIAGVFLFEIREILLPFVVAGMATYACVPLVTRLQAMTGLPRVIIAIFISAMALAAFFAIVFWGMPPLIRDILTLVSDLQGSVERAGRQLIGDGPVVIFGRSLTAAEIAQELVDAIRSWISQIEGIANFAAWSFTALFELLLTIIMYVYLMIGGPGVGTGILWLVPPKQRPFVQYIWSELDPILRRYLLGLLIIAVYAAVTAYLGLGLFLGLKHAVFLALLTGVLELVLIVGPIIAAIIAGLVALNEATGPWSVIAFVVYASVFRLTLDEIIAPIILGRAAQIHPVLVIFCFLSGGALFGIAGVLLAVPVAIAGKIVLETIYDGPHRRRLGDPQS
jgi:predicted PurR-regulated permease PerM